MTKGTMPGGCLCGGIRYEVTGGVKGCAHCHCRMCQRAAGAPVVTWFTVTDEHFTLTKGALKFYKSSAEAERGFCPDCGTQITFRLFKDVGKSLDVTTASLDDPEALPPSFQIWAGARPTWMHGFDAELPVKKGTTEA